MTVMTRTQVSHHENIKCQPCGEFISSQRTLSACVYVTMLNCLCSQDTDEVKWDNLLDRNNAHKLMYSLQVVESLSRPLRRRRRSVVRWS